MSTRTLFSIRFLPLLIGLACASDTTAPREAELVFSVAEHDFGDVTLGIPSDSLHLILVNRGSVRSGQIAVTLAGPNEAEFSIVRDSCSEQQLRSGGTCVVDVRLRPTSPGTKAAVVEAVGGAGIAASAELTGSGNDAGLRFAIDSVSFGENLTGSSRTLALVVRNSGLLPTGVLSTELSGANAALFAILSDACAGRVLAFNGACQISLRYSSSTAGANHAALTISGTPGGRATARLDGASGSPTTLTPTPVGQDFGTQRVRVLGASRTIRITNGGSGTSGALRVLLGGSNFGDFVVNSDPCNGRTLAAGESCEISVRFRAGVAGPRTGAISISDAYGSSATLPLAGIGGTVVFTAAPAALDFGPRMVGSGGAALPVVIRNDGTMASGLVTGEMLCLGFCTQPFSASTCAPIEPGVSCVMEIRFDPLTLGGYAGTMEIADEAGFIRIALTGRGTGLEAPQSMTFAPIPRGSPSPANTVTVTNTGGQPTGVITAQVVGADFEIVANGCRDLAMAAGQSCVVSVRAAAHSQTGTFTGELRFSAIPGGAITTTLRGTVE